MKITTSKDVEELDQKIKDELGIDVRKYKNEEVAEKFGELLVFPQYIVNWTIRPVLVSIVVFILGFYVIDLVHVEYVLYALFGLILFLLNGILLGVLFLTWKMKSDMWGIVAYSLNIMKSAVEDLNQVNNQISPENRKSVLTLLFKGIVHIVTIPMLAKILSDKIPILGGVVKRLVSKILVLVSDKIKFDEEGLKEELKKEGEESKLLQLYSNSISSSIVGLEKIMNITFGIAQFPLKIAFTISFLILIVFIYLIH